MSTNSHVRIDERDITARIELARKRYGISIAELGRRIEVDRKRLWYVLNGQREMRVDEFLKLCIFFDLGPGRFVTREQVMHIRNVPLQP